MPKNNQIVIALLVIAALIGTGWFYLYRGRSTGPTVTIIEIKTEGEFKDLTGTGQSVVKYYAPWCGFCKKMAPVYEGYAKQYPKAHLAKVDFTQEHGKKLAQDAGVNGFPTFVFYKDGKKVDEVIGADEESLKNKLAATYTE